MSRTFSIRMRASQRGLHISGAERLVSRDNIDDAVRPLIERALNHPKGEPDDIHLCIEPIAEDAIRRIPALRMSQQDNNHPEAADAFIDQHLSQITALDAHLRAQVISCFRTVSGLRGAMLVCARTGRRLEPDRARGVRVSVVDAVSHTTKSVKNHRAEALVLASKVVAHPNIVGEICMSDDPDYTTGYVTTSHEYCIVPHIKEVGSTMGTRVFLYNGPDAEVAATIEWLENAPVLVEVPHA